MRSDIFRVGDIVKTYRKKSVLDHVSFEMNSDELISILGPSGSGKSTLLKILAGIESPDSGQFSFVKSEIDQIPYFDNSKNFVPIGLRGIMYVFQEPSLFPHLTVQENLSLGLVAPKSPESKKWIEEIISFFLIGNRLSRYPHELSGGEQQRVVVARSLVGKPLMLLLDEPFSNLDDHLRYKILIDLKSFLSKNGIAACLVTHNQNEAFLFSSRILILKNGKLIQQGSPVELYTHPKNADAAQIVGLSNLLTTEEFGMLNTSIEIPRLPKGEIFLFRPEDLIASVFPINEGKSHEVESHWFFDNRSMVSVVLPTGKQIWCCLSGTTITSSSHRKVCIEIKKYLQIQESSYEDT
ncbi:MAG: ABC transporter ATP-binding protein [Bdellovibrionales bacterium]|nr:ABC transporter ATP-binding protein [Bdellovibrionales bacterium]